MRTASQLFYLAIFSLLHHGHAESRHLTPSRTTDARSCAIEPRAIVSDACVSYNTLDKLNHELAPSLKAITQTTDFFAYYRLNLFNNVCPFWSDSQSMCGNIACAVNTIDNEEDIPSIWRAEELGKLEGPHAGHPGRRQQQERPTNKPLQGGLGEDIDESCVVEYDDECDERDYCVPEDERASAKGDYVSLVDNPERFTGYAGPGAREVWDAIYHENCFSKEAAVLQGTKTSDRMPFGGQASQDFKNVLRERSRQQALAKVSTDTADGASDDGLNTDDECLEKRVFYRVISGMHASISAHICWDYLNQTTGNWGPNLQCYEERLHGHPERVSNLYFNYALVLRAVTKLKNHLQDYVFCSGDVEQDRITKRKVHTLIDQATSGPAIFDETSMFQDSSSPGLKEDFRNRFRNVSRLMDCVGCDKCRLWGKLQTAGYGTALKVLFEYDDNAVKQDNPPLRRTELVALVNTLDRISNSMSALVSLRKMKEARDLGIEPEEDRKQQLFESIFQSNSVEALTEPTPIVEKSPVDEYDDEEEEEVRQAHITPDKTIMEELKEAIREETTRVWKTYVFVLKSWYNFPATFFHIVVLETRRLWNFWIGGPVEPRSWQFSIPSQDDTMR